MGGAKAGADGATKLEKPKWTKIHGRVLDVSKFRHPGGNIIEYFYGMDATTALDSPIDNTPGDVLEAGDVLKKFLSNSAMLLPML